MGGGGGGGGGGGQTDRGQSVMPLSDQRSAGQKRKEGSRSAIMVISGRMTGRKGSVSMLRTEV